ncbi:MAG: AEC family transporter [Anaerolineales bacterium]
MNDLLPLFVNNILPILIAAGLGYALQKRFQFDLQGLTAAIFYILTPALILVLLVETEASAEDMLRLMAVGVIVITTTTLLGWLIGSIARLPSQLTASLILTSAFMNAGNYGLSLNHFAFGAEGLAWASVYFMASAVMTSSLGVYVAQAGKMSPGKALIGILKVPLVWAIPVAVIIRAFEVEIPLGLWRPIEVLSDATIPMLLLLLGMRIAQSGLPTRLPLLGLAVGLRLVVGPALAWLAGSMIGLEGLTAKVAVVESAMPTAVLTTVVAAEFDLEPEFVTGVVLATTLLSPLTVTPILALLGAG